MVERTGNRDLGLGYRDKMDVVCHQDIRPDANAMLLAPILESSKIDEPIRFVMKHGIFSNTTVTNVVCILGQNAPTRSWHICSWGWNPRRARSVYQLFPANLSPKKVPDASDPL